MTPFFTIITPTLQRDSLAVTCAIVDAQTFTDWHHIVIADCSLIEWNPAPFPHHDRRTFMCCQTHHANGGNTCRRMAWRLAQGRYVIYLDDDNYFAGEKILQRIHDALERASFPRVAFFPINRLGSRFFPDGVPRMCHVDTSNLVVEREIGQWPDTDAYGSDGVLIEDLVKKHPYTMFPEEEPIVVMPKISYGKKD